MSNATVKDPPGQEPAPVIPVDAREDLKTKFYQWQALIRKRVELTSKLDEAKNRETALLQMSESSDSEETVRQLQDAQTRQRVYAAQIVQADRDSDSSYDALLLSFKAAVDELARKVESLRASRKAAHWEIFTDRIDTGALLSVRLTDMQLYYALDCAKDVLALNACRPHHWQFLKPRYTSSNANRPEPPADPDFVKRGMEDVLACYARFEVEATKNYNFKPYPPEPIQDEPEVFRSEQVRRGR
jgi:hypothetical protein